MLRKPVPLSKIPRRAVAVATGPTAAQSLELARCAHPITGFDHFVSTYLWIPDTQSHGDGTGKLPFILWPAQRSIIPNLLTDKLLIFLKARQLGISWLVIAYVLWKVLFSPNKTALFLSQGQLEANEMITRAAFLYDNLPDWFRAACPLESRPSVTQINLANGSRIRSLPATPKAGSSFTASIVVMDEAAKMQFARSTYTAVKPTIDAGGQMIVISTAHGAGNFFHTHWRKATEGTNSFRPIFLSWKDRPGRDQGWYDRVLAESADPDEHMQEYPSSDLEAFRSSGNTRFLQSWITWQEQTYAREPLPVDKLPDELRHIAGLSMYVPRSTPALGGTVQRVVCGADIAEGKFDATGKHKGDNNHVVFVNRDTFEEMACIHGHMEPDEFAEAVFKVAVYYRAMIVPERNNHGHMFVLKIRELAKIARMTTLPIAKGPDGYLGWHTNVATKPTTIALLATMLRDHKLKIHSRATLVELADYRKLGNGRTGAPAGAHDDRVMAWAILLGWLFEKPEPSVARAVDSPVGGSYGRTA